MLNQSELQEIFTYKNGTLFWKMDNAEKNIKAGDKATTSISKKREYVNMNGKTHPISRMIYTLLKGNIPEGHHVDHKDRNTLNNKIENLRIATPSQNSCNIGKRSHNKSGIKGVSLDKQSGKWLAHIGLNGKAHHLGYFDSKSEARQAYEMAATLMHGEFVRLD